MAQDDAASDRAQELCSRIVLMKVFCFSRHVARERVLVYRYKRKNGSRCR